MAKESPKGNKPIVQASKPKTAKAEAGKTPKASAKPVARSKAAEAKVPSAKSAKAAKPPISKGKAAHAGGKGKPAASAKVPTKRTPAKRAKGTRGTVNRGDQLYCDVCGIVLTVDEACGCAACDIICCGSQMQARQ